MEPRRRAHAYLLGLLSDVDDRTCWQLAEQAGDRTPYRMQRLIPLTINEIRRLFAKLVANSVHTISYWRDLKIDLADRNLSPLRRSELAFQPSG